MPLATTNDLEAYIGRPLTADEAVTAELLLQIAEANIEAEIGPVLTAGDYDLTFAGTWAIDLVLPGPVSAVSAVTMNGLALAGGTWMWNRRRTIRRGVATANGYDFADDADDDYYGPRQGAQSLRTGLNWGGPDSAVQVAFTGGYTTIPADLKGLCLQLATRPFLNSGQVSAESLGAYSVTYALADGAPVGVALTDVERRTLRRRYGRSATTLAPTAV